MRPAQAVPPPDRFDPDPPPDLPDGPEPDHPDPDPDAPLPAA
jgi:hypothetical protein